MLLPENGLLALASLSKSVRESYGTEEKPVLRVAYQVLLSCFFSLSSWKLSSWSFGKDCLRSFEEISVIICECYQNKPWAELFWKTSLTVCQLLFVVVAALKIQACLLDQLVKYFFSLHSSAALRLLGRWPIISVLPYYLYCLTSYEYDNIILSHLGNLWNIRLCYKVQQSKYIRQLIQVFSFCLFCCCGGGLFSTAALQY